LAVATAERDHTATIRQVHQERKKLERIVGDAAAGLSKISERLAAALNGASEVPLPQSPAPIGREPTPAPTRAPIREPVSSEVSAVDGISGAQQRILDVLAGVEAIGVEGPHKNVVAVFAGVSPTSGGYFNNLGRLRSQGLVVYPRAGAVALTDVGRSMARPPETPATLVGLHDAWCAVLTASQAMILRALIELYPESVEKAELAEQIGVSPTSGGYFNNLGRLRTLGAVDYPQAGSVAATALLFPEHLA
jgi:hypothetical protein